MSSTRCFRWAIVLVSLGLAGCGGFGGATPPPVTGPVGNPAAPASISGAETNDRLLALLQRLADNRRPLVQNSQLVPQSPVITVGGLPAAMPFVMPLEPGSVTLGSIVSKNSLPGEALILLDVPDAAAGIVAFYQTELAKQGFTPWQPGSPEAFQPTSRAYLFCQRDKGVQLELDTYEYPDKPTDARLSCDTNPLVVSCNEAGPDMTTYAETSVPGLTLPDNVVVLANDQLAEQMRDLEQQVRIFRLNFQGFPRFDRIALVLRHFIKPI